MPVYEVTIHGVVYEVESDRELTPQEAYAAALHAAQQEQQPAAVDPELRRHANRAAALGGQPPRAAAPPAAAPPADDGLTAYERRQLGYQTIRERIENLRAQLDELLGSTPPGPERTEAEDMLRQQIRALAEQLPRDRAAIGGAVGNVIGGVAGGLAGTVFPGVGNLAGAAIGSTLGGLAGTTIGGLLDAKVEEMNPEETEAYLTSRGIESVAFDTAGNLLFLGGGRVLRMAKNHPSYQRMVERLGGKVSFDRAARVPPEKIMPGERVFAETTEPELREAAAKGASALTSARGVPVAPTAGQLTDDPGLMEHLARVRHRSHFDATRRRQEDLLNDRIAALLRKVRWGAPERHAGGSYVREALDVTEREVKNYLRPVWDALAREGVEVDMRRIKNAATAALDADLHRGVPLLEASERMWLKKLSGAPDKVRPGDAHAIYSRLAAKARDLRSSTEPNSALLRFYTTAAQDVRQVLDAALGRATQYREARDLYRRAMEVLYDPALMPARRAAESAADARLVRLGEVEGVRAAERLKDLAKEIDILSGRTAAAPAGAKAVSAAKGEFLAKYAGTPDALAALPARMRDPDFRRAFGYAFRTPEERRTLEMLSQAAQQIQRLGISLGTAPGVEAAGASAGGAIGAMTGSGVAARSGTFLGRFASWMVPEVIAVAITRPEVRAELPRIARIAIAAAQGKALAIPDTTRAVMRELDRLAGASGPRDEDVPPSHGVE